MISTSAPAEGAKPSSSLVVGRSLYPWLCVVIWYALSYNGKNAQKSIRAFGASRSLGAQPPDPQKTRFRKQQTASRIPL
jgi:hypothetical protein